MTRWEGVVQLVADAVHHGSLAVERVHQRVARTPLDVAACVPPLAPGARRVAACQAALIGATYSAIRGVNAAAGAAAALALEAATGRRGDDRRARRVPP
jgi:hypothetical protein